MQRLQGIAVSPGVAIGEALVMDTEGFRIPRRFVARDAVVDELERLDKAIVAAGAEIESNRDAIARELGSQYAAIFDAHLQMLRDPKLRGELDAMIRDRHYSPEYAVSRTLRRYAKVFQTLQSSFLADRAGDIFDIEKRLLRNLLGRRREELSQLTSPVVILAHNLTPSETANLDRNFVRGFVTEVGGPGSHTAIVAEALELPAVVGTGPFLSDVGGGDLVIIDGDQGVVILQPDAETVAQYRQQAEQLRSAALQLGSLRDLPAETADGVRIRLLGNIEFPHEVAHCVDRGADGIGLYRTEFLYLTSDTEPTEEDHYQAYSHVIQAMGQRPVVIRTLDLGADKLTTIPGADEERNPFLGLRSIRLSLRNIPLFRTQLRAVLRASVLGDLHVMFPLITTIQELRSAKMVLSDVMEDLEEGQIPFNREIPVGMMVETPAAAMMIDQFVQEVDFISIGTNDLIQYTLAVDRSNKEVAALYNACDPAVLRLIAMSIKAADQAKIAANMCGQMSGSTTYTQLLIGLGLRQFSVAPAAIPEIKQVCRKVNVDQCRQIAERAMSMESARTIKSYLREELKKAVPDAAA
ncbi:MAG TPA: phosphoenolpyruvate--protein phosphotransferase [Pirellulales bacterium]|jgi:phosphotransferase system enzyme I (PtsI)|nr:phosphoenolpyruvate--protein phosphotransferase [Pirellulales bacterium]